MRRTMTMLLAAMMVAVACTGNSFDLEVGQCFQDPPSAAAVVDVDIVHCNEPHDNEVFFVFDLAGDAFPGDERATQLADAGCLAAFQGYVGIDYNTSAYNIRALRPTQQSWDSAGDREVVCFLTDGTLDKTTGSALNSRR